MIRARAPGKVVLWGEYAVLAGAPALVQAVNRYATCTLESGGPAWRCMAQGHPAAPASVDAVRLTDPRPAPADAVWDVLWRAVQAAGGNSLPPGGEAHLDTRAFHWQGRKLGIGSSAAISVATYAAVCRLQSRPADLDGALRVHRAGTGGPATLVAGSGIDVAAAWHGGLLRYRRYSADGTAECQPWTPPPSWHTAFVWSGTPARTSDHLRRLDRWLEHGRDDEFTHLRDLSAALFDSADPLSRLSDYVAALAALDRAAQLGVFSEPHQHLAQLAKRAGVVYKPCGAGGGDIGVGIAADPACTAEFSRLAAIRGFVPLTLETAKHGFEVTG